MSICPHCLEGSCRRHPLQDHGKRANELKKRVSETNLSNVNDLLKAQIERLQGQNKGIAEYDTESFRNQLDLERERVLQRKVRRSETDRTELGLNPSVANLMKRNYNSDEEDSELASKEKGGDESDSSSTSSDDTSRSEKAKKKKHKKRKRKQKKEDKKSRKSKKKSRKDDR